MAEAQSSCPRASAEQRRTNSTPMTPMDYVRLGLFMVFFVGHSAVINLCQLVVSPWLYRISPRLDRKFNQQVERWFCTVLLLGTEIWAPTKLVMSGDQSLGNGRNGASWFRGAVQSGCMLISNHQTYFDWIIIWCMSYFEGCDGFIKIILKAELKHVPVFGWGMQFLDFIFLRRKWAEDQQAFADHMDRIIAHDDPAWLLIFPEGTVLSPNRIKISNDYADKLGIPRPTNTLVPRVQGARFCLERLRGTVPHVYDLTIGYSGLKKGDIPETEYGLVSMYGKGVYPRSIHIHVKRYSVRDIPSDEEGFTRWMLEVFAEKDKRLDRFYEFGRFPHTADEDPEIPAGSEVLQSTRPVKARHAVIETAYMWLQFLAILTPAFYIVSFLARSATGPLLA